ncbi:expressed unknown protein [Seminavis robusta]|uniref:MYND-type domain-containing protein n=1 Tax=Seminavis robusta TaxID=568900 RepID=A0A9N8D8U4_9STRA|nr:expressed unknown protein [Seminavis robusta]|eukprot:Sro43_g026340.1 n/a (232) ;mRNA; f:128683-129378
MFRSMNNVIATCDAAGEEEKSHMLPSEHETAGDSMMKLCHFANELMFSMRDDYVVGKWDPDHFVVLVSPVPGDQCDCCSEEKSIHDMRVCGHCRVTYYCTEECQNKHWQHVHHKLCRKKGEFRCGDIVQTLEPFGSVSFGKYCQIVSPAKKQSKAGNLWLVSDPKGEDTCIISADKLRVDSLVVRGLMGEEDIGVLDSMVKEMQEENGKDTDPPETISISDLYVWSLENVD